MLNIFFWTHSWIFQTETESETRSKGYFTFNHRVGPITVYMSVHMYTCAQIMKVVTNTHARTDTHVQSHTHINMHDTAEEYRGQCVIIEKLIK